MKRVTYLLTGVWLITAMTAFAVAETPKNRLQRIQQPATRTVNKPAVRTPTIKTISTTPKIDPRVTTPKFDRPVQTPKVIQNPTVKFPIADQTPPKRTPPRVIDRPTIKPLPDLKVEDKPIRRPDIKIGDSKPKLPEVKPIDRLPKRPDIKVGNDKPKLPGNNIGNRKPKLPEINDGKVTKIPDLKVGPGLGRPGMKVGDGKGPKLDGKIVGKPDIKKPGIKLDQVIIAKDPQKKLPPGLGKPELLVPKPSKLDFGVRQKSLLNKMQLAHNHKMMGNFAPNVVTTQCGYWPTWFAINFGHHHGWHHGHCFGPIWSPAPHCGWWWDQYPCLTVFGITDYSLCHTSYCFGYWNYHNPFCYHGPHFHGHCNYCQPILCGPALVEVAPSDLEIGLKKFELARLEFMEEHYGLALELVDEALHFIPGDIEIHEFRALVLFAMGNYEAAAAGLYAVLSEGPGWNWDTLKGLYASIDIYNVQMGALESFRTAHPEDSAARFVLAYHYKAREMNLEAAEQLEIVHSKNPDDRLVADLLRKMNPEVVLLREVKTVTLPTVEEEFGIQMLLGNWTASREDGGQFALALNQDGSFGWNFSQGELKSNLKGAFALQEKGVLALEMQDGAVMLAQIVPQEGGFDFYMLGDSEGMPPLQFRR